MKKIILSKVMLCVFFFSSCASEEIAVQEKSSQKFEKTAEMLHFESALKEWMLQKKEIKQSEGQVDLSKVNTVEISNAAKELLSSIGVGSEELSRLKTTSVEELVSFTMKEYSKSIKELKNN